MSDIHEWFGRSGPVLKNMSSHWHVIRSAQQFNEEGRAALMALVERYYRPIYRTLLTWGIAREEAIELTHRFTADFCDGYVVAMANQDRGQFRDYLTACLRNFVRKQRRSEEVRRPRPVATGDLCAREQEPQDDLERQMAWETFTQARKETEGRLGAESVPWRAFHLHDLEPEGRLNKTPSEWGDVFGVSAKQFYRALYRARQVFKEEACRLLADTVATETQLDAEIGWFVRCIRQGPVT